MMVEFVIVDKVCCGLLVPYLLSKVHHGTNAAVVQDKIGVTPAIIVFRVAK